ncbi:MAG: class I SAM-dependent methyltransferase [Pirellulales bacterium]
MSLSAALSRLRWLYVHVPSQQRALQKRINAVCRGWSGRVHWRTFRKILREHPQIRSICILGVYQGRDIAYLSAALQSEGRDYEITGVDLFDDVPGDDWPEAKRGLTWEQAGFGKPPNLKLAESNLETLGYSRGVRLIQSPAAEFLRSTTETFDLIYIDVAHDYRTTKDVIPLAADRLNSGGILAGDDYSNFGSWGVAAAVTEQCPRHKVHYGWIWTDQPVGEPVGAR